MNEYLYTAHITYHPKRFTILIAWDRTSAREGATGCRYQFIFDLTHPPNPCMKCRMKLEIDHHTDSPDSKITLKKWIYKDFLIVEFSFLITNNKTKNFISNLDTFSGFTLVRTKTRTTSLFYKVDDRCINTRFLNAFKQAWKSVCQ